MEKEKELLANKRKNSVSVSESTDFPNQKKRKISLDMGLEDESQVSFILSQIQDPIEEEKAAISPLPTVKEKKKLQSPNVSKIIHYSPNTKNTLHNLHSSPKSPKTDFHYSPSSHASPKSPKPNYGHPKSPSPVVPFSPQRSFSNQPEDDSMMIPSKKRLEREVEELRVKYQKIGEELQKKHDQLDYLNQEECKFLKLFGKTSD